MNRNYLTLFIAFLLINILFTTYAYGENLKLTIPPGGGRVSIEFLTYDALFNNTLSLVSPSNVGIWASGCSLEPVVGSEGYLKLLSAKKSQHGCRVDLDADASTPNIQDPFPAGTLTLEFSMCSLTTPNDTCTYNWDSDPAKNSGEGSFDHVKTIPLVPGTVYAMDWEDLPVAISDKDFNDLNVTVRIDKDTDGDGLWDDWETQGIDTDGDGVPDFKLPGADPMHKDIYLEIDYMDCAVAGGDCATGDTHSHKPKTAAIDSVIKAFANAPVDNPDGKKGINIHVDVSNAIAHQNLLNFDDGVGIGDFDKVKADPANFGTTNPRRFAYHYVLFTHRQGDTTSSGQGELPGNDYYVSLGEWNTVCITSGNNGILDTTPAGDDVNVAVGITRWIFTGPNLICDTKATGDDIQVVAKGSAPTKDLDGDGLDDRTVGTVMQQAGTLMHELGHNLNLHHGGDVDIPNFKPNYLSVMNYWFQMSGILPTNRLDYSRNALATLDEAHLDETKGIGDGTDNTEYQCPPPGGANIGSGTGPIDWNCDGDGGVQTNISADINNDGSKSKMGGFDDWTNLKYDFQNSREYEDGVHFKVNIPEMDFQTFLRITLGEIRGMKFNDLNGNGIKEPGEPGLAGWTIILKDSNGNMVGTNMTDINGNYAFVNVTAGNYTIGEVLQPGWKQTAPAGGTYTITLSPGQNVNNIDFGNKQYSIYGMKFNDLDGNGKKDPGEPGLAGWHIKLVGVDTLTNTRVNREEVTDANGNYGFMDVSPGTYQVLEVMQGSNWVPTTYPTVPVNLKANDSINVNFGNKQIP